YISERAGSAPNGKTWEEWLQHHRFELNAFTSAELIAWLDGKMAEHDAGKLIPPDDILADQFNEQARPRVEDAVNAAIDSCCDDVVDAIKAEEAEARKPILAELYHISAPLLAELARVRAPLLERMRVVSEPFRQRIGAVQADADAIDRETEVHRMIERMRPAA